MRHVSTNHEISCGISNGMAVPIVVIMPVAFLPQTVPTPAVLPPLLGTKVAAFSPPPLTLSRRPPATMSATVYRTSFWSLFGAFVTGGLFFSTAATAAVAAYAFGVDNIKRVALVLQVVVRRVLDIALAMLRMAWLALINDQSTTRWADARAALLQGFQQTRLAAAEGVDAIKLEASLYAYPPIGAPGLLPLQYVLDRLTPSTLVPAFKEAISDSLASVDNPNIKRMRLKRFDIGGTPPRLMGARLYGSALGPSRPAQHASAQYGASSSSQVRPRRADDRARRRRLVAVGDQGGSGGHDGPRGCARAGQRAQFTIRGRDPPHGRRVAVVRTRVRRHPRLIPVGAQGRVRPNGRRRRVDEAAMAAHGGSKGASQNRVEDATECCLGWPTDGTECCH